MRMTTFSPWCLARILERRFRAFVSVECVASWARMALKSVASSRARWPSSRSARWSWYAFAITMAIPAKQSSQDRGFTSLKVMKMTGYLPAWRRALSEEAIASPSKSPLLSSGLRSRKYRSIERLSVLPKRRGRGMRRTCAPASSTASMKGVLSTYWYPSSRKVRKSEIPRGKRTGGAVTARATVRPAASACKRHGSTFSTGCRTPPLPADCLRGSSPDGARVRVAGRKRASRGRPPSCR